MLIVLNFRSQIGWKVAYQRLVVLLSFIYLAAALKPCAAETMPFIRSAGLWEVRLKKPLQPEIRILQCTDPTVEPIVLMAIAAGQTHCDRKSYSVNGGALKIMTECRVHDRTVHTEVELTGDRKKFYQGQLHQHWFDAVGKSLPDEGGIAFDAKRLGACSSGMAMGDMRLSNGIVVNVVRDARRHEEEVDARDSH